MPENSRPTFVEVDLRAILANYHRIREAVGPGVGIMGIVKADAYGHGAVPVARTLVGAGAEWLGVARLEEGVELRMAGIQAPILLLGGAEPEEAEAIREFSLQCAVFTDELIEALDAEGRQWDRKLHVHLKVDTGMHRLGAAMDDLERITSKIMTSPGLSLEGVMSHFASAEDPQGDQTQGQLQAFERAVETVERVSGRRLFRHLSNSTGAVTLPRTRHDLVRPGIMLYGAHMAEITRNQIRLEPAFSWKARIRQVKRVKTGDPVGYSALWKAERDSTIAIVSAGYADGFSRSLTNRAQVIVNGRRVPVAGRVSMDLIAVDVTDAGDVRTGNEVTIIGRDGSASVTVEEWAGWLGTIPYEIFCAVSRRVPRFHRGMAEP